MKKKLLFLCMTVMLMFCCCTSGTPDGENPEIERQMSAIYGENMVLDTIPDGHPVAVTQTGVYVGMDSVGVSSFKGIPYAKAPVGELRWKDPVMPDTSAVIHEAYYYGKTSMQTRTDMMLASYYKQGEDCLTLNVWTSGTDSAALKPVMVFIHGGSFAWDGTSSPAYECHNLVKDYPDMVFVTVNYRLGIMGFIDFTEVEGGEDYASSVNLGLLDQIAALKWVNQNIKAFGGDPESVTIFGESAGAACVTLLPLIPESKGLFKRMIAESGSVGLVQKAGKGVELTKRIMDLTGAENMQDLLKLSSEELYDIYLSIENGLNTPTCDGSILPLDPFKAYADGVVRDIDILAGTNANEATLWIDEMGGMSTAKLLLPIMYQSILYSLEDDEQKQLEGLYKDREGDEPWQYCDFITETTFRCPMLLMADKHSEAGGNAYVYYFAHRSALSYYGACHGIELGYVFNNSHIKTLTGDSVSATLVKAVPEMWINFAKTGNPSTADITVPRYNTETRPMVRLDNVITIEHDILSNTRTVIEPLIEKYGAMNNMPITMNIPIVWKIGITLLVIIVLVVALVVYVIRKVVIRQQKR